MIAIDFLLAVPNFVSTGHTGAGVLQSPRHKVTKRGRDVDLRCDPISGHAGLYWYRQAVGQGPEFLVSFQNEDKVDSSGMPSNDRFQVNRSEGSYSILQIQRAEPGDSAVYLCASSPTTVGHSHLLPLHQPHVSTSHSSQNPCTKELPASSSSGATCGFGT